MARPRKGRNMNNLTEFVEGKMKEFDKEFESEDGYDFFDQGQRISQVQSFLRSSFNELLDEVKKGLPEEKGVSELFGLPHTNLPTKELAEMVLQKEGYNRAIKEMRSHLKGIKI